MCVCVCTTDSLSILEGDNCHLVHDKGVLGGDAECLAEEALGKLGVVGQTVL